MLTLTLLNDFITLMDRISKNIEPENKHIVEEGKHEKCFHNSNSNRNEDIVMKRHYKKRMSLLVLLMYKTS